MATAVSGLVNVLESYRGRDRLMRTLCYSCQLLGGVITLKHGEKKLWGKSLLIVASQLSNCRTVLRLFDDLSMLTYSLQYGLGKKEDDYLIRVISVVGNIFDQLYYPCEHVAWAADAGVIHTKSDKWWTASTALWGLSLMVGIVRSLRILLKLRRSKGKHVADDPPKSRGASSISATYTDTGSKFSACHVKGEKEEGECYSTQNSERCSKAYPLHHVPVVTSSSSFTYIAPPTLQRCTENICHSDHTFPLSWNVRETPEFWVGLWGEYCICPLPSAPLSFETTGQQQSFSVNYFQTEIWTSVGRGNVYYLPALTALIL
ncbi:peroxisomal membrane protein 11C isoform X1 [Mixophyes fleayi]|uniref:peroxisomal membrane protein 11C isoform X1 n=1 Tax=Mixophyes fleayi TaxID=3061075 RepID=UPI003F4DABB1